MKVKDFEKAITVLNCPVVLDEVKLSKGHVTSPTGGTAFSEMNVFCYPAALCYLCDRSLR